MWRDDVEKTWLSRRLLLGVGGGALAAMSMSGCDLFSTRPAKQGNDGSRSTKGKEAPSLAKRVSDGALPPVEDRMPNGPLVIEPTERAGRYGGRLRNALLGTANSAYIWCLGGYENLLRWYEHWTGATGSDELLPNVAERFEVNEDSTSFTFWLRPGMNWSNGEPFGADDVVFAVDDVLLNSELYPVTPSMLSVEEGTATVEKVDDQVVRFVFPSPAGLFLQKLATYEGIEPLKYPRHYLEQFHADHNPQVDELVSEHGAQDWVQLFQDKSQTYGHNPHLPSLAAWRLVTPYGDGQQVVLERNPYYWKVDPDGSQLPYIDELVFDVVNDTEVMMLKTLNGDINIEVGPDTRFTSPANKPVLARERDQGDYRFLDVSGTRMNAMVIALNLTHEDLSKRELFQTKDFRIGLSHAINRQEIVDTTMQRQGEPYQVAPLPNSPFYDEEFATQYLEYDTDKANQYLDMVAPEQDREGFRLGRDGNPINITIEYVETFRPEWTDMLELIKGYWKEVGVELRLRNMESSLSTNRKTANKHEASVWHGDGGLDVLLTTGYYFPSSFGSENYAQAWRMWYESEGSNGEEPPQPTKQQMELYDRVKGSADPDEQHSLMTELLQIGKEEFYLIGVVRETDKYFIAANNIHNVPGKMIQGWSYPTPGSTRTEQYFIAGGRES